MSDCDHAAGLIVKMAASGLRRRAPLAMTAVPATAVTTVAGVTLCSVGRPMSAA